MSSQQQQTLVNKTAIISGSNSGIGAAIARELSSRGARVVINYPFPNLKSQADAVIASLTHAECAVAVCADISTTTGPQKLVDATITHFGGGPIDMLINNAALAVNKPLADQTLEDWDRLVNLNGRGVFLLTQAVLKYLPPYTPTVVVDREGDDDDDVSSASASASATTADPVERSYQEKSGTGGGGRIVNIVSISSRGPPPGQTIYAGTKGMVDSFTRCWAKELPGRYGCTVNAVSPGPTRTEGFADAGPEAMKLLGPVIHQTPVAPRMAESEEIAYVVGCLCEERARWVNGAHVMATGGLFVD